MVTILYLFQIAGKIPLLRIRNPWGNEAEWKGAWSDRFVKALIGGFRGVGKVIMIIDPS